MKTDKILAIYDSHITYEESELFLCLNEMGQHCWFKSDDLPPDMYLEFIKSKSQPDYGISCNRDKSKFFSCDMKTKTRGIQIGCTNCGICVCWRELYGSESLTQVGLLHLDTCDNFNRKMVKTHKT